MNVICTLLCKCSSSLLYILNVHITHTLLIAYIYNCIAHSMTIIHSKHAPLTDAVDYIKNFTNILHILNMNLRTLFFINVLYILNVHLTHVLLIMTVYYCYCTLCT